MRILDDADEPYGCDFCRDSFYLADQCQEHEEVCDHRELAGNGFELVDEDSDLSDLLEE